MTRRYNRQPVKLQEFHAKRLLLAHGLPVPDFTLATTPAEAREAAATYLASGAGRVVIKAQVLVGGRGKAGGVKLAATPEEAERVAGQIIGLDIKGTTVRRVIVAPAAEIAHEYYLACVLDRTARRVMLMASAQGGVEIEQVAAADPDAIATVHAHPHLGLADFQARQLAFAIDLPTELLREFVAIARGLFATMIASDADLVEINPLAAVVEPLPDATGHQVLECLDAKITIDDSALERQPAIAAMRDLDEEDPVDVAAREEGLSFIRLEGNIGCMVNGAGLAMTTMDLIKRAGGEPANFLDIGGGAKHDKVEAAMRLILADTHVQAILVNIFGGIARGDEVAQGLVEARRAQERHVPMVVRIVGTNASEAARILAEAGDPDIQTAASLDQAVELAVAAARAALPA
jgi:succinyl-CoA synthetase beta subunit